MEYRAEYPLGATERCQSRTALWYVRGVMAKVFFKPSEVYRERAQTICSKVEGIVCDQLPDADVQDIGATSVPGLLTKGDVDINVRVSRQDFPKAVELLKSNFGVAQPENWGDGFASFSDEGSYELPVGVQLTIIGESEDKFAGQQARLVTSPELVQRYNALKREYQGKEMGAYRDAKWAFIAEFLGPDSAPQ